MRLPMLSLILLCVAATAQALECGNYSFPKCDGQDVQYAGHFDPGVGFGGFGGGDCKATRTPVIFIHGNADRAINWAAPVTGPTTGRSVYEEFKTHGYNDCELFGVTYFDKDEQAAPQGNYHKPEKYHIIDTFIDKVKAYTGQSQVDIVAHSLGVSMSLAALTVEPSKWKSVRRFVNIAGGIRGLNSCLVVGYANLLAPTCGSQNILDSRVFGLYPDSREDPFGGNGWTGASGVYSLRTMPRKHKQVLFYTIDAGTHDEILCTTVQGASNCKDSALFSRSPNVRAQLDVGTGATAGEIDWDFQDGSPWNLMGGDSNGVGHYKARINTGAIQYQMLNSDCTNDACSVMGYSGPVKVDR
jgi:pimeloyl-ACP methyl ester carboxylesterase